MYQVSAIKVSYGLHFVQNNFFLKYSANEGYFKYLFMCKHMLFKMTADKILTCKLLRWKVVAPDASLFLGGFEVMRV